jgi:soluble cytochrome b562
MIPGKSLVAAGIVFLAGAVSASTQPPAASTPATPAGRGPQPLVPVAASTLAANPDRYIGSMVTLTAAVDRTFAGTAFSVDQDRAKSDERDVLVLAALLTAPVQPNSYVTVIGEVVRFDPAAVAARMKDATPLLPADVAAKYQGRPAIIATSVINSAMTDLAKKLPPPMTPAEQALSSAMKQVGPGFSALRQAAAASSAADAATQAAAVKKGFTEAAAFWKVTPRRDAAQWTADAIRVSDEIVASAGRGDLEAVKAAVPKLQQICSTCHNVYRDRLDDGSYRFRAAAR